MTTATASNGTNDDQVRLSFGGITPEVREALAAFWPVVEKALPEILDGFYGLATSQPKLAALVGTQVPRLKTAQGSHWQRMFSGRFDADYFKSVRIIGEVHNRIGLEPRWYIAGYSYISSQLLALAVSHFGITRRKQLALTQQAIIRAVFLDMDLAISTYQEAMLEERQARQRTIENAISDFDGGLKQVLSGLGAARQDLRSTSTDLRGASDTMTEQAVSVAAASQQASSNVQTVAAASEELSASINEIARRMETTALLTRNTVEGAERASQSIQALSASAQEIGSIVEMINAIASQTKLLALNATIEAARAGEAGKGFSVVADEVKSLANETERATGNIGKQIGAIRDATDATVQVVESIAGMVGELNEVSAAIAAAIEEQSAATREIASNVQQAATATSEVSNKIDVVSSVASTTSNAVDLLQNANSNLETEAEALRNRVDAFFSSVRAA